jgi:hypothetical protein
MAVKNAVSIIFSNSAHNAPPVANFDGLLNSIYPDGDKPSGVQLTPTIVFTDLKGIKLVGGINNRGDWIRFFCYSPGRASNLGQTNGCKVMIRDPLGGSTGTDTGWHEVAAYWHLKTSPTFVRNQLVEVCVQPGNLGGNMVTGRSLDAKLVVNGVDSNIMTGVFIVQVGNFWYVDPSIGNESTGAANDPTKPFKYPQVWTGSTFTGLCSKSNFGPGDTVVLRNTDGTDHTSQNGYNSRYFRLARAQAGSWSPAVGGGTTPTSSPNTGWITFYGYPGEDPHGKFSQGGGIHGSESSFAAAGWGKYIQISNFSMELTAGAASDGGMVYLQNGGDYWRAVGNKLGPWPSTIAGGNRSASITGQGQNGFLAGNECFGINGLTQEAHGIYMGGAGNAGDAFIGATKNTEICYNWCHDIYAGTGIQFNWQGTGAGDTQYFTGNSVHHNYIENTFKYGVNVGDSSQSCDVFNNVMVNIGLNPIRLQTSNVTLTINIYCNTCYGWNTRGSIADAAVFTEAFADLGVVNIDHNIFAANGSRSTSNSWYANGGAGDSAIKMKENIWWDFKTSGGLTGVPSKDSAFGKSVNPNFTDLTSSPPNLTRTAGADMVQSEVQAAVTDFLGIIRGGAGAHKWIGAYEGVGT